MRDLKLVFSQPYPLRKLSPETLGAISKIVALRTELYEQVEALEMALGTSIQGEWMAELVDFDYPDRKQHMTLAEGQRFVAKLLHEVELDND